MLFHYLRLVFLVCIVFPQLANASAPGASNTSLCQVLSVFFGNPNAADPLVLALGNTLQWVEVPPIGLVKASQQHFLKIFGLQCHDDPVSARFQVEAVRLLFLTNKDGHLIDKQVDTGMMEHRINTNSVTGKLDYETYYLDEAASKLQILPIYGQIGEISENALEVRMVNDDKLTGQKSCLNTKVHVAVACRVSQKKIFTRDEFGLLVLKTQNEIEIYNNHWDIVEVIHLPEKIVAAVRPEYVMTR